MVLGTLTFSFCEPFSLELERNDICGFNKLLSPKTPPPPPDISHQLDSVERSLGSSRLVSMSLGSFRLDSPQHAKRAV
jgi:hypothetical protein